VIEGPFALYLAMGMVATVNPCGFAMLPAYLSYFLGVERVEGAAPDDARAGVGQALRVALAVSGGFLAVFAVAGTIVRTVDDTIVYENMPWVSIVIGLALLVLGVAMVAGFEWSARLPRLDRGGRSRSAGSMFVFGVSYAVASVGCTLPLFLTAVAGTIERQSLADGIAVFLVYGLGMTIVLTALTVTIALARTSLVRLLRRSQEYVSRVSGGLVALAGAYVAYYGALELRRYRSPGATPESGITDTVAGWSYDITEWVNDVGAVRIAVFLAVALAALAVGLNTRRGGPSTTAGASSPASPDDAKG
jgi:cytochrome c-type biogenesis protein